MERKLTKGKTCKNCGRLFDQRQFGETCCCFNCKYAWKDKLAEENEALKLKYSHAPIENETDGNSLIEKSIPALIKIAEKHFNAYIRKRDEGQPCISCGEPRKLQAGHFYPVKYGCLRFHEYNVNGQCKECNCFEDGNFDEYRPRLQIKIGAILLLMLDNEVEHYRHVGWKWAKPYLIGIITEYKEKIKQL